MVARRADTNSLEARFLEEWVDVSHLSQRLDPGIGAEFTGGAYEVGGDASPSVRWMNHHALQQRDLPVECLQRRAAPATAAAKELIPQS